ncbi:hypothetical protein Tcan_11394 [Toxocara canis]|uniref:Uncharacterized protein n=1 Tax=Toxocara canis TaxID=6265 RepID=A0A0B2VUU2_TOXCA|nr:hypothetical protein Tcan_11394 [Toxocara canis]
MDAATQIKERLGGTRPQRLSRLFCYARSALLCKVALLGFALSSFILSNAIYVAMCSIKRQVNRQATEYLQSGNPAVTLKIRPLVKEPDETVMRIDYVIVGDEIHALNRSFSVINDPLYAVSRVVQRAGSGAHTWIFASVLLLVIVTVVYTCILIYKNHNQRASYFIHYGDKWKKARENFFSSFFFNNLIGVGENLAVPE